MAGDYVTIGAWDVNPKTRLLILSDRAANTFVLALDDGAGAQTAATFESEEAAHTAAALIERLAAASEHARLGGELAGSGMDTSHPGVEWFASASDDMSVDFLERLSRYDTVRLWIAPSLDGRVFALLNPGVPDDERVLGVFDSKESADATVRVLDALFGN